MSLEPVAHCQLKEKLLLRNEYNQASHYKPGNNYSYLISFQAKDGDETAGLVKHHSSKRCLCFIVFVYISASTDFHEWVVCLL